MHLNMFVFNNAIIAHLWVYMNYLYDRTNQAFKQAPAFFLAYFMKF